MARGKAKKTLELIEAARAFLEANAPATVRSCCYQLLIRGLLRNMSKTETNKVSRNLVWAREEGLIPWGWVVDETRSAERSASWDNPEELIETAVRQYRKDYWQDQPVHLEIWSEKGTVRGTLGPVLREYGVTFRVMHGFGSATVIQNFAEWSRYHHKPIIVGYVGDWDPSGLYMSEVDIPTRLKRYGGNVTFQRIALTRDDISTGDLPSFEVASKTSDTRYRWWAGQNLGSRCWELDAMAPAVLRDRVEDFIVRHLDLELWERAREVEAAEIESMRSITTRMQDLISGPATEYGGAP